MKPLLAFQQVSCVRGGRLLFSDLDLAVGAGEGLLVTGHNGSGKSSLIRLAAGLLRAASGTVERAPAALADDAPALDRERTLRSALHFWIGDDADAALEQLALSPFAALPVRHLSAGQRRRASLARVAGSGALLWLLDEPLNGLDSASVDRVEAIIAAHRARGGAVVVASHTPIDGAWKTLELGR